MYKKMFAFIYGFLKYSLATSKSAGHKGSKKNCWQITSRAIFVTRCCPGALTEQDYAEHTVLLEAIIYKKTSGHNTN